MSTQLIMPSVLLIRPVQARPEEDKGLVWAAAGSELCQTHSVCVCDAPRQDGLDLWISDLCKPPHTRSAHALGRNGLLLFGWFHDLFSLHDSCVLVCSMCMHPKELFTDTPRIVHVCACMRGCSV